MDTPHLRSPELARRRTRRLWPCGLLLACLFLLVACGGPSAAVRATTSPAPSDVIESRPATETAPSALVEDPPALVEDPPGRRAWAAGVCTAMQSYLDAHTYAEPYGGPLEGPPTVEEIRDEGLRLAPRLVTAARTAVRLLGGVRPTSADEAEYQSSIIETLERLAEVYQRRSERLEAADSLPALTAIDRETLVEAASLLDAGRAAFDRRPAESQAALSAVGRCTLLR
jgi:hypothetical protein